MRTNRQDAKTPSQEKRELVGEDDTFDTVFQEFHVEVDEQTEVEVSCFQIRDYLGLVDGYQTLYRFQFHHEHAIHQQVKTTLPDRPATILNRNGYLTLKRNSANL